MIRLASTASRLLAICVFVALSACDQSTAVERPRLQPGTYDLTLPYFGAKTWPAPVPQEYNSSNLGCARYVNGWYIIGADGSVEAHRVFESGSTTWTEVLFGHARLGPETATIDYGGWEEGAYNARGDRYGTLYVAHHFRGSGTCATTHHLLRYTRRPTP